MKRKYRLKREYRHSFRAIFEFIVMGICAIGLLWFVITLGIFVLSMVGYTF